MGYFEYSVLRALSVCLSVSVSLFFLSPPLSLCMLHGGTHGLMVGKVPGQTVGETYGKMEGRTHGQIVGEIHLPIIGETHGQIVGEIHLPIVGRTHGQIVGETHGQMVGETHGQTVSKRVQADERRRAGRTPTRSKRWRFVPPPMKAAVATLPSARAFKQLAVQRERKKREEKKAQRPSKVNLIKQTCFSDSSPICLSHCVLLFEAASFFCRHTDTSYPLPSPPHV